MIFYNKKRSNKDKMKKVRNILLMAMMTFAAVSAQQGAMKLALDRTMKVESGHSVNIPLLC